MPSIYAGIHYTCSIQTCASYDCMNRALPNKGFKVPVGAAVRYSHANKTKNIYVGQRDRRHPRTLPLGGAPFPCVPLFFCFKQFYLHIFCVSLWHAVSIYCSWLLWARAGSCQYLMISERINNKIWSLTESSDRLTHQAIGWLTKQAANSKKRPAELTERREHSRGQRHRLRQPTEGNALLPVQQESLEGGAEDVIED